MLTMSGLAGAMNARLLKTGLPPAGLLPTVRRYLSVGALTTAIGYAIIVLALHLGADDYRANAAGYLVGMALGYHLHRRWTFAAPGPASLAEAARFAAAALAAYAVNLGVIALARHLGFIDSPLTHIAAMASYSATFFLLGRHAVFTAAHRPPALAPSGRFPGLALAAAALFAWLPARATPPMDDVVWQFWIARQLLGGARLYADIWEVNPPLWFWSAVPLEWLAERTGLGWWTVLSAALVALGAVSARLVGHLLAADDARLRTGVQLLALAATTLLPLVGLGQREQIALAATLPYLALIARRRAGQPVALPLALFVGALAAPGFALKHYFVLTPLALEAWLFAGQRRAWRPWRPELAVLAAGAIAYLAAILLFAPAFVTQIVPMVRVTYYAFQPTLLFMLVKPYTLFWLLAALYLWLVRDEERTPAPAPLAAFQQALLLLAACAATAYFLQRRGWDYHSFQASGALALAIGLHLLRLRRPLPLLLGAALLGSLAWGVYPPRRAPVNEAYLEQVPRGEAVFVAAVTADPVWPAPDRRGLLWTPRVYSLWMALAIAEGELVGPSTPALQRLSARFLAAMSQDIRCHPPALVLLQRAPVLATPAAAFTYRDYLLRDAALRRFLTDYYRPLPPSRDFLAWRRAGPVAPLADPACRTIR
ncbi:MAG: GtrA family protein [Sphingomonadales bacterium]|nr:GtrA family protein [Sphingomonadales bacterium]